MSDWGDRELYHVITVMDDDEPPNQEPLCPFCGALSPRQCELKDEMDGVCAWEEMKDMDPPYSGRA